MIRWFINISLFSFYGNKNLIKKPLNLPFLLLDKKFLWLTSDDLSENAAFLNGALLKSRALPLWMADVENKKNV